MFQAKILLRQDTTTNWATANPILSKGEPAYDETTGALYIGDGVTNFNSLIPINSDSVTPFIVKTASFTAEPNSSYLASGNSITVTAPTTVEGTFDIYVDSNNTSNVTFGSNSLAPGAAVRVFANNAGQWSVNSLVPVFDTINGGNANS